MDTNVKKEPTMLNPRSTFLFFITARNININAIKFIILAKSSAKLARLEASIFTLVSLSHNGFAQLKTYADTKL